jgi:hypothetical protein
MIDRRIPAFKKPLYVAGVGILLILMCALFPSKSFPSILLAGLGFFLFGASRLWKLVLAISQMTTYAIPFAFTDLRSNPVMYLVMLTVDLVLCIFGLFVGSVLLLSLTT